MELGGRGANGQIVILTGLRGAGKTTLCQRLVDLARKQGWKVAGLISPGHFEAGCKVWIEAEDLSSGGRHVLAVAHSVCHPGEMGTGWAFNAEWLAWGNRVLAAIDHPDLLVIDEMGPLEFTQDAGWRAGLELLDRGSFRLAFAVIRPELLEQARIRWPKAQVIEIVATDDVQRSAARLAEQFLA